jgi:predicted small secreted protein
MKKVIALLSLSAFMVVLAAGCQTMEGAGKDIQWTGEQLEDAAR